ncbi:MAG: adenosylcobinamide amidohydrolase [Negativicutes bacterium]
MKDRITLHILTDGDPVIWNPANRSVSIEFTGPRKVLGTSLLNGGYREDLNGIFNHNCGPDNGSLCELRAPIYLDHMRLVARDAGFDPELTTGMGTSADMANVAIATRSFRELNVAAIVTGGVEGNGGRVGDPATYYQPGEKTAVHKPGTINIMLVMDADMPPGTMARALVTCTEAKTAALQELMAGSLYSRGLATGSGTDQTIIVANPTSSLYFEGAGKHNKLGELIGQAVKQAVAEALQKQSGLSPAMQHDMLRRFKRFGLTEDSLQLQYSIENNSRTVNREKFVVVLRQFAMNPQVVVKSSLFVHLLDQLQWNLFEEKEVVGAANELMAAVAQQYGADWAPVQQGDVDECLKAWSALVVRCVAAQELAAIYRGAV